MAAEKADKRRALWTKVERGGQQISGLLIDCRRVARVWKTHGLKHWPGLDRATWGRWAHCPVLYVPENLDLFSSRPEWSRGNERAKEPRRERLLSFNRRHQERGRTTEGREEARLTNGYRPSRRFTPILFFRSVFQKSSLPRPMETSLLLSSTRPIDYIILSSLVPCGGGTVRFSSFNDETVGRIFETGNDFEKCLSFFFFFFFLEEPTDLSRWKIK